MVDRLRALDLSLAYDERRVVEGLTMAVPDGAITVIVGPNACGKSTLLRGLGRLLAPDAGQVVLDGADIHRQPTREVARTLGILPQSPVAPEGITVADLVARGRHPHHRWYQQWGRDHDEVIARALEATATLDLADRSVDELSGGQRQRVWIAMAMAQEATIMLLDEPTTFLDVTHQVEVLDLLVDLNEDDGRTIVLVLHDLNLAARYGHHLIAMADGAIVAEGPPEEVVTEDLVSWVFGLSCRVVPDPVSATPLVVPIGRHRTSPPAPRHPSPHLTEGQP